MSSQPSPSSAGKDTKDWSAKQYLLFNNERTRPVHDLISQIKPHLSQKSSPRILDLGCGPGNSTSALLTHFPSARATGLDSSPDMLQKARRELPDVEFLQGDVSTFELPSSNNNTEDSADKVDLLFSNAVFHWLRTPTRIPTLSRLFTSLPPGGILAIQMPDNYTQPSHASMREVALQPNQPWTSFFADAQIGDLSCASRPDLDPIEPPSAYYEALAPHAAVVNIWRTEYMHVLSGAGAIVEWVKGTGLQPFLNMIEDEAARKGFLKCYEGMLEKKYKTMVDGKVLLGYPRLFVLAVRK